MLPPLPGRSVAVLGIEACRRGEAQPALAMFGQFHAPAESTRQSEQRRRLRSGAEQQQARRACDVQAACIVGYRLDVDRRAAFVERVTLPADDRAAGAGTRVAGDEYQFEVEVVCDRRAQCAAQR